MMSEQITALLIPNTYVKLLTQDFDDHDGLARGTDIAPQDLPHYAQLVTVAQHVRSIQNAIRMAPNLDWHLQWGKRMAEKFHGPVTLAWLAAPTLGAGLDAFIKYMPSRIPYLTWSGTQDDDRCSYAVRELIDLGIARYALVEIPLIVMYEYVRVIRPATLVGASIELSYPAPPHAALFSEWFRCPIKFSCDRNALVIPTAWRDTANPDYDEVTWQSSLARCDTLCAVVSERDIVTEVQRMIYDHLNATKHLRLLTLDQVAARLHMSSRTLIRRLRRANTTFQDLSDEILKRRARELLTQRDARVQDISMQLGYCDPTSFRRAFKRWYGTTPAAYRAQQ